MDRPPLEWKPHRLRRSSSAYPHRGLYHGLGSRYLQAHVLRQLKKLGSGDANDTASSTEDPDILSVCGDVQLVDDWALALPTEMAHLNKSDTDLPLLYDPLEKFKTTHRIARDARIINSRLCALYLTRNNVKMLLKGFTNRQAVSRGIIAALGPQCVVVLQNEDVLNAVEVRWTGERRSGASSTEDESTAKIYARFRISYYIDHNWNQVRELTYLAMSNDARDLLMEAAKYKNLSAQKTKSRPRDCSETMLLRTIDGFLNRTVSEDFQATLMRQTFSMGLKRVPNDVVPWHITMEQDRQDSIEKSRGIAMQDIVDKAYLMSRSIRVSSRRDSGRPLDSNTSESNISKALVYSKVQNPPAVPQGGSESSNQNLCLYVLDGRVEDITSSSLVSGLEGHFQNNGIFGTVRGKRSIFRSKTDHKDDNRACCQFKLSEIEEHFKVTEKDLLSKIQNWKELLK